MKKFTCLLLALLLACSLSLSVSAKAIDELPVPAVTVEYYEDGSYLVTEVVQNAVPANADGILSTSGTTSGTKTATYYNANNVAVWAVRVTAYFNYTSEVLAYCTSSAADVYIYDSICQFVSKSASRSGASGSATAQVKYITTTMSRTATLTCDTYGNLS